jgi:hypothetical protein
MSEQKHDGHLDDSNWTHAKAEYAMIYTDVEINGVYIHGGYGDMESSAISLDAKQALSLLTWLEQEKPRLEQLAKEGTPSAAP